MHEQEQNVRGLSLSLYLLMAACTQVQGVCACGITNNPVFTGIIEAD